MELLLIIDNNNFMSNLTFNFDDNCEHDLIINLCEYLRLLSHSCTTKVCKLYFYKECDSHQSPFENLSNNLDICVLSNDDTVAKVILVLLGVVIDNNSNYLRKCLEYDVYTNTTRHTISLKDAVHALELSVFDESILTFDLDEKIATTKSEYDRKDKRVKYYEVTKELFDVDIWTLSRITTSIQNKYLY